MMKNKGFTLIELLVSFLMFIALIMVLVNFTTVSLDAWNQGEERKEMMDRQQAAVSVIEEDFRNLFVQRRPLWIGTEDNKRYLLGAHLICDVDKNRRPRLRFVRVADRDETLKKPAPLNRRVHPADYFTDLYEVCYLMDEDPAKNILYRAVRYFDRIDEARSYLMNPKFSKAEFKPVDKNLLYLEFRFWAQDTTCWDRSDPPAHVRELIDATADWDSSRHALPKFRFYQRRTNFDAPDWVYPEMVQVTMVIQSQAFSDKRLALTAELSETGTELQMNATRELADAPNFVKVGGEWVEYSEKMPSALKLSKRGARNTKREAHPLGEEVHFGETFVRTFYLPVKVEALSK